MFFAHSTLRSRLVELYQGLNWLTTNHLFETILICIILCLISTLCIIVSMKCSQMKAYVTQKSNLLFWLAKNMICQ